MRSLAIAFMLICLASLAPGYAQTSLTTLSDARAWTPDHYKTYPVLDATGFQRRRNSSMPFTPESAPAKEIRSRQLDDIVAVVGTHPNVVSFCLCNELWWADNADYDPGDFQQFERERYDGDLAALNNAWDTRFASFDQVSFSPRTRAAREDMGRYTAFRVTRWLQWEQDRLRQAHAQRPASVKVHGGWWSVAGVDPDGILAALDAGGVDTYPNYGPTRWSVSGKRENDSRFAADFWTQAIITDTYRSLQPHKPIIDSEYHLVMYGEPYGLEQAPAAYYQTMLWQGALHGRDAAYLWIAECRGLRPWVSYDSFDYLLLTQPWTMDAVGRAALDLERLAEYVVAFQQASEVAILRTGVAFPEWYKQLYFQDCGLDIVTPTGVEQGSLRRYKVLVAPEGAYLSARGMAAIAEFLRDGGKLILGAEALRWDEQDRRNDLSVLKRYRNAVMRIGAGNLQHKLDQALQRCAVARPVRSAARHVELRSTTVQGRTVRYAINFDVEPQTVRLGGQGTDLLSGRRLRDMVQLGPLEMVLVDMN